MNQRLLIANLPWRTADRVGVRAGSRWPFTMNLHPSQTRMGYAPYPFFMAYATAVYERSYCKAIKHSRDVKMIDAIAEFMSTPSFHRTVSDYKPTHICIETSTPSIKNDLQWAELLKKDTGAHIILTGSHATTFHQELIDLPYIDTIILGEYDLALTSFMELDKDGVIDIVNPKYVENLDKLPYPAWHHTPMLNYYDATSQLERPVLNVMASRGCTHACSFCLWPQTMYDREAHWRSRDPHKVVEEIQEAQMRYNNMFKGLFFEDDTWGAEADWAWEFTEEYGRYENKLPFCILTRADIMDYDLLKELHRVGLRTFRFGVESGCQAIVDRMGKGLDLATVKQTIDNCNDIGINTEFSICYGFPGETKESVAETQEFIKKLNPTALVQALATPYPGTRFYEELDRQGMIETKDWDDYDGFYSATFRSEGMTKQELEGLFRRITGQ